MKPFYHEAQVEADGEKLTLVCDFYAITAIEGITGEDWDDLLPRLTSRSVAVKVLWGMLRRKHEGVTLDEAAAIAFGRDQQLVGLAMGDLIRRACNIGEPDGEKEPPAKKKRSGRSPASARSG
jgi:hypothetical protein